MSCEYTETIKNGNKVYDRPPGSGIIGNDRSNRIGPSDDRQFITQLHIVTCIIMIPILSGQDRAVVRSKVLDLPFHESYISDNHGRVGQNGKVYK